MNTAPRVKIKETVRPDTPVGWMGAAKGAVATAKTAAAPISSLAELLQLDTDTQGLDAAQAKAKNKGRDEITARDAEWRVVQKSYRSFAAAVQKLCDAAPDFEHAKAIAAAAGLAFKVKSTGGRPEFYGKAVGNGAVRLYGRRPAQKSTNAFFEWQQLGADGKTWATVATTNKASTQVAGLTVLSTVSFRYRKTVKDVPGPWSQTVDVLVR